MSALFIGRRPGHWAVGSYCSTDLCVCLCGVAPSTARFYLCGHSDKTHWPPPPPPSHTNHQNGSRKKNARHNEKLCAAHKFEFRARERSVLNGLSLEADGLGSGELRGRNNSPWRKIAFWLRIQRLSKNKNNNRKPWMMMMMMMSIWQECPRPFWQKWFFYFCFGLKWLAV